MKRLLVVAALAAAMCGAQSFREIVAATDGPLWLSYSVPIAPGQHQMCNWKEQRKVMLEGSRELTVLFRVEHRAVGKIRVATEDCEIDSGGVPLKRIEVTPAESVAILSEFLQMDTALMAISLHADPSATPVLVKAARENAKSRTRGQALFWLAQSGQRTIARDEIAHAVDADPDTEVRKKAVFALTQLPGGEGVPKLIEVAQSNRNAAVRKQAMFWLGQSKDARAIDFFEKILSK